MSIPTDTKLFSEFLDSDFPLLVDFVTGTFSCDIGIVHHFNDDDILTALYLWMFSSASFRQGQIEEQLHQADGQQFLSMITVQRAMDSDVMLRQAQIFQQGDISRVIDSVPFRSERWRSQLAAAWATANQRESAEAESEAKWQDR